MRQEVLDVPGVEPVGQVLRQRLIQQPQELGLGKPERGVRTEPGQLDAPGIDTDYGREPRPELAGCALPRHGDDVDLVGRDMPRPHVEAGQGVVERPEPRQVPVGGNRLDVDDGAEPFLPPGRAEGLNGLLPFGGQQGREVAHGKDDVHLGREQRPDGAIGLLRGARRQHLIRDDGCLGSLQRLAHQDVPLANPRIGRIGVRSLSLTQIPAGPGMIPSLVARQQDTLAREPGAVAPHGALQERRARLGLADVQVNTGTAGTWHP